MFGFDLIGSVFPILFIIVFAIVIVTFIVTAAKGLSQWHQNNQSPRLTVEAEIVSRHEDVSVHHHNTGNGAGHISHSTTYYATFQVASGDRRSSRCPGGSTAFW